MRAAALFTGGKDSASAVLRASQEGAEVVVLASVVPAYDYSMLFHRPNFQVLSLQANAMGLPLETVGVADPAREGEALGKLLARVKARYRVDAVVTGALASRYQLRAFKAACEGLGLALLSPHWGVDQEAYMRWLAESGIKYVLFSITTMGLPMEYLGRVVDREVTEDIIRRARRYGFNPAFEGGEAETLVVDAPFFRRGICLDAEKRVLSEFEGRLVVRSAFLC
ncbi:MAG: diphthine--ammonia ligase [Desulfurococcaceae archaeon]